MMNFRAKITENNAYLQHVSKKVQLRMLNAYGHNVQRLYKRGIDRNWASLVFDIMARRLSTPTHPVTKGAVVMAFVTGRVAALNDDDPKHVLTTFDLATSLRHPDDALFVKRIDGAETNKLA